MLNFEERCELSDAHKSDIIQIWNTVYPIDIAHNSLENFNDYLSKSSDFKHYLGLDDQSNARAWLAAFTRDGARWFSALIDPQFQGAGAGTQLLNLMKESEPAINGWVVAHTNFIKTDGSRYLSPMLFYVKNGFTIHPGVRLKTDQIDAVKISWKRE